MIPKRIAIVHEWWTSFGGSENTFIEIAKIFPEADLWVLYKDKNLNRSSDIELRLRESWMRFVPFHENRIISTMLAPLAFRSLTFKKYDLVISSSHTFAHMVKNINNRNTVYFSYVYTPARALWLPNLDPRGKLLHKNFLASMLKRLDKSSAKGIDAIASISHEVSLRVKDFWDRESVVIYPPVDLKRGESTKGSKPNDFSLESKKYLLTAGRLVGYKNHQFAIRVASEMNTPLVIMGAGPEHHDLIEKAKLSGVETHFIISPDDFTWTYILENAKALIFAGIEDFGITPIEAISVGTPVFALARGGALEYVQNGINGALIDELNPVSFAREIGNFESSKEVMIESVEKFGTEVFHKNFRIWIENEYDKSKK